MGFSDNHSFTMSFEKPARLEQQGPAFTITFNEKGSWSLKREGKEILRSDIERMGKYLYIAIVGQNRVTKDRQMNPYFKDTEGRSRTVPQKNFADTLTDAVDCDTFVRLAVGAGEPFDIDWIRGWNHMPHIPFFHKKTFRLFQTADTLSAYAKYKLKVGQIGVMGVEPSKQEEDFTNGSHTTFILHGIDGELYLLQKMGLKQFEIVPLSSRFDTIKRSYGSMFAVKEARSLLKFVGKKLSALPSEE